MNKKLIAIAVVAALAPATAMADIKNVEIYGRIHASLDSVTGNANANTLALNDNSSRLGVKASHDMGNGLTGVLQFEAGLDGNGAGNGAALPGLRDTYIGLAGGFGTILTGKLPAANQYVYDSNLFADQLGDAANFTGGTLAGVGRANRALHYVAPKFGDVTVALTYLPASSTVSSTAIATAGNTTGIKVSYAANGVSASLTHFNVQTGTGFNVQPLSIAGSYDFGSGMLSAQYVSAKNEAGGNTKRNVYNIGGKFKVSGSGAVKAQYSHASENAAAAANGGSMFVVGYDHNLSKQMDMYVVYAQTTNEAAGTYTVDNWGHNNAAGVTGAGNDPKGFGIGLSYNF